MQLGTLIIRLSEFLKLQNPVTVIIKTEKAPEEPQAEYAPIYSDDTGELEAHEITIWLDGIETQGRDFNTIVAHEFIHAWQEERGLSDIHGFAFRSEATELEKTFPKLRGIFCAEIDEE